MRLPVLPPSYQLVDIVIIALSPKEAMSYFARPSFLKTPALEENRSINPDLNFLTSQRIILGLKPGAILLYFTRIRALKLRVSVCKAAPSLERTFPW